MMGVNYASAYQNGARHAVIVLGASAAMEKLAAGVDRERLMEFSRQLRPGDLVNFQSVAGDAWENGLGSGYEHLAMATPTKAFTFSPDTHTSIFTGMDPNTGEPMIVHNYDGLKHEPLANYAATNRFAQHRLPVTDAEAAAASQSLVDLHRTTPSPYPMRNAIAAGFNDVGDALQAPGGGALARLRRFFSRGFKSTSNVIGKQCDPGTAICSYLPVEGYGRVLGQDRAQKLLTGKPLEAGREQWSVTPATIAANVPATGTGYQPLNTAGDGFFGAVRGIGRNMREKLRRLAGKKSPALPGGAPPLALPPRSAA